MKHLTINQVEHLRKMLMDEKESLEHRLAIDDHFGFKESFKDSTREFSLYDNHPADIGTEMYEREKDIALHENTEHQLEEVIIALENMNTGKYGICIMCDKEIPYERLEALPSTMYCKEDSPETSVSLRRPIEEKIMAPPYGRTSLDELPEQNQFDGEDAWQIVESWGNSDSPAMAENREIHSYNEVYIEEDEYEGFVEPIESFIATDIYGSNVSIVRNHQYRQYIENNEGMQLFEPDELETLE